MTSCFLTARECPHPASGLFVFFRPTPPKKKKKMKSVKRGDEDVVVFQTIPLIGRLWSSRAFRLTVSSQYSANTVCFNKIDEYRFWSVVRLQ